MLKSNKPLRVLFVVSSPYWITGEEVRQIMKYNSPIKGVMCSVSLVDELFERTPSLEEKIDLVHFMVPVAGRRHIDKFLGRRPCVATIYHIDPSYAPDAISINAKADSVMIISEMWRSELIARGVSAEKIFLMPNGVDTSVFRPPIESERSNLRRNMGFEPDEIVIGFSGQVGRDNGWRKGLDVFIDALKILADQGKRIAVVVGGPGCGAALAKIRAIGIKAYRRPYVLNAEDGAPMYRALDFFWVTSRIEGGPAPLVEAMSSGVSCISTKVGIAPEIIRNGINGYLVDIEDATQIATSTSMLMDSPVAREGMGREARNTIVATYDCSKTAKRASVLYETTMLNFDRKYGLANHQYSGTDVSMENILSQRDSRWLEEQEQLGWSRVLCRMGERWAALGFGWRATLKHPFSIRTWSFLSNLVLSDQVRELVRILRTGSRS